MSAGARNADGRPVKRRGEEALREASELFASVAMGLRENKVAAGLGTDDKILAAGLVKLVEGFSEELRSLRAEIGRLKSLPK